MEKKLTNSGPLREPADKHSIYTMNLSEVVQGAETRSSADYAMISTMSVWQQLQ
jgi:hypothetical protein